MLYMCSRLLINRACTFQTLQQAAKIFAQQDYGVENTEQNLKKMDNINEQIKIQLHRIRLGEVDAIGQRLDKCLRTSSATTPNI